MNNAQRTLLTTARGQITTAINTTSHVTRQSNISLARNNTFSAFTGLGSGMNFQIGAGTNIF